MAEKYVLLQFLTSYRKYSRGSLATVREPVARRLLAITDGFGRPIAIKKGKGKPPSGPDVVNHDPAMAEQIEINRAMVAEDHTAGAAYPTPPKD